MEKYKLESIKFRLNSQNLINIFIYILILSKLGCSYISIPSEVRNNTVSSRYNIGIALVPSGFYPDKPMRSESEVLNSALKSIHDYSIDSKNNLVIIDTFNNDFEFDNTQEYLSLNKKNILELEYQYLQVSVPIFMNLLGVSTLGLLPIKQTFQFKINPIFYNSEGKKYPLTAIDSPTIDEWKSWLLFPFSFSESKEKEYIRYVVAETINSSISEIEEKKISVSKFNSYTKMLDLPFRMRMDVASCKKSIEYGYRGFINAGYNNKICLVSVYFSNKSNRSINIDSKKFTLNIDGVEIKSMESINYSKSEGEKNLQSTKSLEKGDSGITTIFNILFSIPDSLGNTIYLKYFDKEIYPDPIYIKFLLYEE